MTTPNSRRTPVSRPQQIRGGSSSWSMRTRGALAQPYFSYTDPHLTHYFKRKLRASRSTPATPTKRGPATIIISQPKPSWIQRTTYNYTIAIATATAQNSGTTAKVYVSLNGSRGKLFRHRLVKSAGETAFTPGSTISFKVVCGDLGDLRTVTLEHSGLTKEEAWLVNHVTVRVEGPDRCWIFPCNQWLSLHHLDGQISRTLTPQRSFFSQTPSSHYHLHLHTGDVRGGGTEAHVFVTLHGTSASSAKTELQGPFSRGSVMKDKVVVVGKQGELVSVDVEHDNTGFAPDWFLDKVVVWQDGGSKGPAVTLPCGRWLSRREGDGRLHCSLYPTSNHTPPTHSTLSYTVTTKTGNMRGAGTDANVYVSLYGTLAESGEKRLDNDPQNFERRMQDNFSIVSLPLGRVERVRVYHDNSGLGPGWYLEWLEVREEGSKDVWHFPCDRWLEVCKDRGVRGGGDGDSCGGGGSEGGRGGSVEVELIEGDKGNGRSVIKEKGYQYTVHVTTGDMAGGGTSAGVYIVMVGRGGNSGKLWLDNGQPSLLQGQTDTFDVNSPILISPFHTIIVGHNNRGQTPGWYLQQIVVVCDATGEKWLFPCQHWLCVDCEDGEIERELHAQVEHVKGSGGGDEGWMVRVWTSDMRGGGTDATVSIQLHGPERSSSVVALGGGDEYFQEGEEDSFPISLPCLFLPLSSLTLSHDNTGPYPEWHVQKVAVENRNTGECFAFNCGSWISKEADGGCSVTLTSPKHSSPSQTHMSSTVTLTHAPGWTTTIQKENLLSENSVSIEFNTKEEWMKKEVNGYEEDWEEEGEEEDEWEEVKEKDEEEEHVEGEESQEESFVHPSMHGSVSTLTSEYLEQLAVQNSSLASPDRKSREKTIPYTIHIAVSHHPSTSAGHLVVEVIGVGGGSSGPLPLCPVEGAPPLPGNTEIFSVEGKEITEPLALKLYVTESDCADGWNVEEVVVHMPTTGHAYHFPCMRWVEPNTTYDLSAEEIPSSASSSLITSSSCHSTQPTMRVYEVRVLTGDKKHAGTENNVLLRVEGEEGVSRKLILRNSQRTSKFQRGQTDSFQIVLPAAISEPKVVSVAHCPPTTNPSVSLSKQNAWYLYEIILHELPNGRNYHFPCRKWLTSTLSHSPEFISLPLSKNS